MNPRWYWLRAPEAEGGAAAVEEPKVEGAGAGEEAQQQEEQKTEAKGEGEGETKGESKPEPAAPPVEDYRDKRIAKLTARLREAEAAKAALEAQARSGNANSDESEIDRRASEKAAALASQRAFDEACLAARSKGDEVYGKDVMQQRVDSLTKLIDRDDPQSVSAYNQFLLAALETGEAAKLIHDLGSDLNEANRVLSLPPIKMAVELAKRATMEPAAPVTRAPKPITPIGAKGSSNVNIRASDAEQADKLSTAEWMTRRNEEVKARIERYGR